MDYTLTAEQQAADQKIAEWFFHGTRQVFILSGYAGTGKTTLLKHTITETLGLVPDESVAFVTPTGKAATVLIKKGIPACTLHRLIYQSVAQKQDLIVNGKTITVEKLIFHRRDSIDKAIRLIVLDEGSMVSDDTLYDILNFGVKVLICGDNAQLPPVEGLNSYLSSPDVMLTSIVRQEKDNPIIQLATLAREGKYIPYGHYGDRAFVLDKRKFCGEQRKKLLLKANQVICGTNRTRAILNDEIRRYLGRGNLPEHGDKLICTYNNWEQFIDDEMRFNLVNGIIGTAIDPVCFPDRKMAFTQFLPDFLEEICDDPLPFDLGIFTDGMYAYKHTDMFEHCDENGEPIGVFNLNRFEYGYCISCHKAQGSEFDSVIVFDESYAFKEDKNKWLYTAITRAKNKLILLR